MRSVSNKNIGKITKGSGRMGSTKGRVARGGIRRHIRGRGK